MSQFVKFTQSDTNAIENGVITFNTSDHKIYVGNGTSATQYSQFKEASITINSNDTITINNNGLVCGEMLQRIIDAHNALATYTPIQRPTYNWQTVDVSWSPHTYSDGESTYTYYTMSDSLYITPSKYANNSFLKFKFSENVNPYIYYDGKSSYQQSRMNDYPYLWVYDAEMNMTTGECYSINTTYTKDNPYRIYASFDGLKYFSGQFLGTTIDSSQSGATFSTYVGCLGVGTWTSIMGSCVWKDIMHFGFQNSSVCDDYAVLPGYYDSSYVGVVSGGCSQSFSDEAIWKFENYYDSTIDKSVTNVFFSKDYGVTWIKSIDAINLNISEDESEKVVEKE